MMNICAFRVKIYRRFDQFSSVFDDIMHASSNDEGLDTINTSEDG